MSAAQIIRMLNFLGSVYQLLAKWPFHADEHCTLNGKSLFCNKRFDFAFEL